MKRNIITAFILLGLTLCCHAASETKETHINTQSLDGKWQIVFDHKQEGKDKKWHLQENFEKLSDIRSIDVPSCWELIEKDYEGVAYYSRKFKIPEDWKEKTIRLHFDAVNFRTTVWINDQQACFNEGGFTPFEFRIDKFIKHDEENTLTMRVVGPVLLQNKKVDGLGPMETPQWRGAISGGIWQSVKMIASDNVYVKDVYIEPKFAHDIAGFHLELTNDGDKNIPTEIKISVSSAKKPKKPVAEITKKLELTPGLNKKSYEVKIPKVEHWSPDNPHLYRADVSVVYDKKESDSWNNRFGFREFTVRNKKFYFNNKPIYLKATFFEGLYPTKLAYPDSREMAIREIKLAKECGFNMIRPWRKPPPPMWLDLCDEMGVLTVGSLVIECMDLPHATPSLPNWVEQEVRESITRDRNRACVVQWELFNELKQPMLKNMLYPMSMLTRQLDPTRLILDESGGWTHGANLYLPYETTKTKFNDIHDYPGPQINEEVYNKLIWAASITHDEMRNRGLRGRLPGRNVALNMMTVFSELGYGSLPNLAANNKQFEEEGNPIAPTTIYHRRLADEHMQVIKDAGFDKIYPNIEQFCLDQQLMHGIANKRMMEAVRCNPLVIGYCVHALAAGDWIMGAGLIDLWRNPKTYAYEGTKAANQPRILPVRMFPRNVYSEQGTKIEITGVNELDPVKGTLRIEIISENGEKVLEKEVGIEMASGIKQLFFEEIDTKEMKGSYTFKTRFTPVDDSLVAQNEYSFDVFTPEQLITPKKRIAILDPKNKLKTFLEKRGMEYEYFAPTTDPSLTVFVADSEPRKPLEKKLFEDFKKFIKDGGKVVYLGGGGTKWPWGLPGKAVPVLPEPLLIKKSIGNWLGVSHIVTDHPVFDGLPVNCMMGPIYENVWAEGSLLDVEGEIIAGSVSFDFTREFKVSMRHYYGPGPAWWGADVAKVPYGEGYYILSQLKLVAYLGKDPVADKIFYNLIDFTN